MGTKVLKHNSPSSLERRTTRTSSDTKRISEFSSDSRRRISFNKPTPLDFDTFIPWVCLEWQVPNLVTVVRMNQEKVTLHRHDRRTGSKSTSRSVRQHHHIEDESTFKKGTSVSNTVVTRSSQVIDNMITITAYYDTHGHLAEISINLCFTSLHRKIIQAISLCIPFHSFLTKLAIRRGCLDCLSLHEISKLLPHSNLTNVCLDDSYVPEGNYYEILDHASNVKYLSLNRCKIDDEVCKKIAMRIDFGGPAEKSLHALDLSCNKITDQGAHYFGEVLRSNRHLLHLNFSGNKITDIGFVYLVRNLKEFPLTYDENIAKKRRKVDYLRRKHEVYQRCLEELTLVQKSENLNLQTDKLSSTATNKHTKFRKQKKSMPIVKEPSRKDIAEKMTLEILGEHVDPFDDYNVSKKDDYCYCIGNFVFCSLNIAYNSLQFPSLLRIIEVLKYQTRFEKTSLKTGLLRIVLEGNYLPNACPELERIETYLKMATDLQIPVELRSSFSKKKTSLTYGKIK